jgi:hypothetical protein
VLGLYAYDYENHAASRGDIITEAWVVDEGPHYTEPSFVSKMSEYRSGLNSFGVTDSDEHGKGLCSSDFCRDDEQGDYT